MKNRLIILGAMTAGIALLASCNKWLEDRQTYERVLQLDTTVDYNDNPNIPGHFDNLGIALNNAKAHLGKVLFYDEILSASERISCASCHKQAMGFADNKPKSAGFSFIDSQRNSMPLSNKLIQGSNAFWDMRPGAPNGSVLVPITNHIEMGNESIDDVIAAISEKPYYAALFEAAFGDSDITEGRLQMALWEFVSALRSYRAPIDAVTPESGFTWNSGSPAPLLSDPQERRGFEVFTESGCGNCHSGPDFGGSGSANIGLEMNYTDVGRAIWSQEESMIGQFKIPTLRNVMVTAPYMHDGRFATIDEVINHYNSGVQKHPNVDWRLLEPISEITLEEAVNQGVNTIDIITGDISDQDLLFMLQPKRLNLTEEDKAALKAFLHTLTDEAFLSDKRFADPFILIEK